MAPIRVLLVDDSDVYRESLVYLLDRYDDISVAGTAADGAAALRQAGELRPDVVVLDYRLPDLAGADVAAALREQARESAIVVLSASAGREEQEAAASVAARLVRKDEGVDALVAAVRDAARKNGS